jgi:cell division protein FtsB
MKKLHILIFCLLFSNAYSQEFQEKEIETKVNEVTVFIDGAQVTRKKTVDIIAGKTILKFVKLSPFIDAKSVQVKANGEVTVLSVNHQQNFIDKLEKSKELTELENKLDEIDEMMKLENTYLAIIKEELAFLKENRDIGGKNQALSVTNLKEASTFYSTKLTSLKMKEIERNKTLKSLSKEKRMINNQINTLTSKKDYPTGEVLVKIDAKSNAKTKFEISYTVANAGWFPTYDIRAKNINEPIELIYKANVRQDTKVDWKNVKLKFSSSNPKTSGVAPELKTYFLSYNTLPPTYKHSINSISGKLYGVEDGLSIPGVSVIVQDNPTIGTTTDINGNYSLTIPNNATHLVYSFIGMKDQTLPINNSVMNVGLEAESMEMDAVVVTAIGISRDAKALGYSTTENLQGKVAGVSRGAYKNEYKIRGTSSLAIPSAQIENQTTVDFEIKTPYTVKSDNKSYAIDMTVYNLESDYQYYCVPKIDRDAFLIANITDWEKYNLLAGEANIFFEETFIGKTLLDVRYASDTLQISLGRDKNVSVSREKLTDFTTKQFIGNKKEETKAWTINVKNNKSQKINMVILDQIPKSLLEEIEVELQKRSGAKYNTETGEVKWEFTLEPSSKKNFELKYSVKYPKYRNLIIE